MTAPVGPPILVRMPSDLLARIDEIARAAGWSRAETIRELLARAIGS